MKLFFISSLPWRYKRWLRLLICFIFFLSLTSPFVWLARAEGSRNLYPNGATGFRANTEWRNSFYGANFLRRRTLLQVYANAGEVILVSSSAVGVNNGDIRIYNPGSVGGNIGDEAIPGAPSFSCQAQRGLVPNPDLGRITSRAQELVGPDTIADPVAGTPGNGLPGGYVPCFYPVPASGIYNVVFYGPEGDGSDNQILPTGQIDLTNPNNFNNQQSTSVAAWDVTVRSSLASTTDLNGRLFTNYLTLFSGGNPRPINSTLFILTVDGYIYQTDMRGLDPNGFIVYANSTGFFNSDNTSLFYDVVADPGISVQQQNQLNVLQGGTSIAPPNHLIFFNRPSQEAIDSNGIPTPIFPQINGLTFNGSLGSNNTLVSAGGTFLYSSNTTGTYEFIISRDGVDFDPTLPTNRVLRGGPLPAGNQNVPWDGLDNDGNPFPPGLNYPVRLSIRAGEYHFPLLDIENSLDGGPQYTLLNPPNGTCPTFNGGSANCNIAFYDDRGYTSANGTDVGTPGQPLPGNGPPAQPRSDPLAGFDTTSNQRGFGNGTDAGFGDKKGLDIWTFFPSDVLRTNLNIFALDLQLNKTDAGVTTTPGGTIVYTLTYTNTGPSDATGVIITDTVPANTAFNQAASVPTTWSCADGSPAGTVCTTSLGTVPGNNIPGTVNFAVTVDNPLPAGVTQIDNTATVGDDGSHGPDPTPPNNTSSDFTPIVNPAFPPPDLTLIKTATSISTSPGATLSFSLAYANVSTTTATGVVISDTIPANTTFNAAASAPTIWSCANGSPAGTVCTTFIGTVVGGSNGTATIAITIDNPLPAGVTDIDNAAVVGDDGSHGKDPTPPNNTSVTRTPLNPAPGPDLTLTKNVNGNPVTPGAIIAYSLAYANVSPTTATGVMITETVPANTIFNAATSAPTTWSCPDGSAAGIICLTSIGTVPGNSNGTVAFGVKVNNPLPAGVTQITNAALVGDDGTHGPDPTPQNNHDDAIVPTNPGSSPSPGNKNNNNDNNDNNDDGDNNNNSGTNPPPPGGSGSPGAPPAGPASPLPVVFLPETGIRDAESVYQVMTVLGLLVFSGTGAAAFWLWQKRKE